jgi:hypothetical protein
LTIVYRNARSGDPARTAGSEKRNHVRHIRRLPDALQRLHGENEAAVRLGFREMTWPFDHSRSDGIGGRRARTSQPASAEVSASGMAAMPRASAIITSAYPPSTVIPDTTGFWQFTMSPRLHGSQTPSSPPKKPTPTR